jgi:hypothetical protein
MNEDGRESLNKKASIRKDKANGTLLKSTNLSCLNEFLPPLKVYAIIKEYAMGKHKSFRVK